MNTVNFEDVVDRLEQVQKFEKYVSALCVFHIDSKPSMLVFKDGWFRCLGCGRNGNLTTLWNKISGQPVVVKSEQRTAFAGPPLREGESLEEICYQAHFDLLQFSSFQWYLEMRGLQNRIETNEIGYIRGWYTFPVRDYEGAFQTAVLRAAPHVQQVNGQRYWCRSAPTPYVPDWYMLKNSQVIFVVYGIMDALTLSELRFPVMTSTAGNNTFHPEWLDDYRVPIFIIPDKGEEVQASRLANSLGWRGKVLNLQYPVGVKDANGFLEIGRPEELSKQLMSVARKV